MDLHKHLASEVDSGPALYVAGDPCVAGTADAFHVDLACRTLRKHQGVDGRDGRVCLVCDGRHPCLTHRWAVALLWTAGWTESQIRQLGGSLDRKMASS